MKSSATRRRDDLRFRRRTRSCRESRRSWDFRSVRQYFHDSFVCSQSNQSLLVGFEGLSKRLCRWKTTWCLVWYGRVVYGSRVYFGGDDYCEDYRERSDEMCVVNDEINEDKLFCPRKSIREEKNAQKSHALIFTIDELSRFAFFKSARTESD